MLFSSRIELHSPTLDLVEPLQKALSESYHLHHHFLEWAEPTPSILSVTASMNVAKEQFELKSQELRFFILRRDNHSLVGSVSLHIRDALVPYYEIGYWVRDSAKKKGYITEAVLLLSDYALIHLNAVRLEIRTAAKNKKSIAVAERAGFKLEATLQNACRSMNQLDDLLIYCRISHETHSPAIDLIDLSVDD